MLDRMKKIITFALMKCFAFQYFYDIFAQSYLNHHLGI